VRLPPELRSWSRLFLVLLVEAVVLVLLLILVADVVIPLAAPPVGVPATPTLPRPLGDGGG
jgi:hypothetical protein